MPSGDTASPGCCATPSGASACSATLSMTIVGATSNRAQEGLFLVVSRSPGKGLLERCRAFLFQNFALTRDGGQDAHSVTHAAALLHPIFMVDRERLRKPLRAS